MTTATPKAIDQHLDAVLCASGSALRHYTTQKTLDDMRAAMRTAMAADTPDPTQATTITDLIELARTVNLALDDSEEMEGDHGRQHVIDGQHFDDVCEALARLEALPDDKPGAAMGPSQKAQWALRGLLTEGAT